MVTSSTNNSLMFANDVNRVGGTKYQHKQTTYQMEDDTQNKCLWTYANNPNTCVFFLQIADNKPLRLGAQADLVLSCSHMSEGPFSE